MTSAATLRPAQTADDTFLMRLEAGLGTHLRGCRELGPEATARLARLLLVGREAAWKAAWPEARCLVIECEGEAVGRLWITDPGDDWQLLHVAVLPTHRHRGLASQAVAQWLVEADRAGARVSTRTAQVDTARCLIDRFDFRFAGGTASSAHLRRLPLSGIGRWCEERTLPMAA